MDMEFGPTLFFHIGILVFCEKLNLVDFNFLNFLKYEGVIFLYLFPPTP